MSRRVSVFVDGENLAMRYKEMLNTRTSYGNVIHIPDVFVWSPRLTGSAVTMDILRVAYYTSMIGDQSKLDEAARQISTTGYFSPRVHITSDGTQRLIPHVFKRSNGQKKSRIVDIEITIDVMRALSTDVEGILLLTGDSDFLSLVHEVTRRTSKQVYVGAFSSGLAEVLPRSVDRFIDLDPLFFEPLPV